MRDSIPKLFDPAENCGQCSPREIFARFGYAPPPSAELGDRQLPGRLWELLYAAGARRLFFCSTDHLSDRDFYTLLREQWLDEPTADIPLEAETNTTTIVSEFNAGGLTHEEIFLRYYADEDDHAKHAKDYPKDKLPPKEKPTCNRDWRLPKGPF